MGSSKDILYLVISFCILWTTVFLCWVFYYVARILKNTSQIVEEFRVRLQGLSDAVNYVRGKVEHMTSLMGAMTTGVGGFVKKAVTRKAHEWVDGKTNKFNAAAKEAVDRAVDLTSKKMKKAAKRLKK